MQNILTFFKKTRSDSYGPIEYGSIAGAAAMFIMLSMATIANPSIWFDEAFSAYLIRFDFWQIAVYTSVDVHPPLYYWLLKAWSGLFGTDELGLRSMSVFFGAVAIIFGYVLVRKFFGRFAAAIAVFLMAVTPIFIRYSQEARMYTLMTAIAFASTYVLALATETKKRSYWVAYGILIGLGLWVHYFIALVIIAHLAWRCFLVLQKNQTRRAFMRAFFDKNWLVAHALALVIILPWLPFLVRQLFTVQTSGFWIPPVTPTTIPNFLTNVMYYKDQGLVDPWGSLIFIVVLLTVVVVAVRHFTIFNGVQRKVYGLMGAVVLVPVTTLFVLSMPPLSPSFVDRYLVPSALMTALFLGVTVAFIRRRLLRLGLLVALFGMMAVGITQVYAYGNYNKNTFSSNNTREVMEIIASRDDVSVVPIVAETPWLFYEAVFYESSLHPVYFLDASTGYEYGSLEMLKVNDYGKIKDLAAFSRQYRDVWYITRSRGAVVQPPDASWQEVEEFMVNDSVSGQPLYKAIRYHTQ